MKLLIVQAGGDSFDLPLSTGNTREFKTTAKSRYLSGAVTFTAEAYDTDSNLIYQSAPNTVNVDTNPTTELTLILINQNPPDAVYEEIGPHFVSGLLYPGNAGVGDTITIRVEAVDPDGTDSAIVHTMTNPTGTLFQSPLPTCVPGAGGVCTYSYVVASADLTDAANGNDITFGFKATDSQALEADITMQAVVDLSGVIETEILLNEVPWFTDMSEGDLYVGSGETTSTFGVTVHDDFDSVATWTVAISKEDIGSGTVDTAGDCDAARLTGTRDGTALTAFTGTMTQFDDVLTLTYTALTTHPDPDVKCKITTTLQDNHTPTPNVEVLTLYQYVGTKNSLVGPGIEFTFFDNIAPAVGASVTATVMVGMHSPGMTAPTADYTVNGFADTGSATGVALVQDTVDPEQYELVVTFVANGAAGTLDVTIHSDGTTATETMTIAGLATCETDEYVFTNVCTACAAGTSRPEGDDPTGPDTACSARRLGEATAVAVRRMAAATAAVPSESNIDFSMAMSISIVNGTVTTASSTLPDDKGLPETSKDSRDTWRAIAIVLMVGLVIYIIILMMRKKAAAAATTTTTTTTTAGLELRDVKAPAQARAPAPALGSRLASATARDRHRLIAPESVGRQWSFHE